MAELTSLAFGDLTIKKDTHEVFRRARRILLRNKEYALLEFLMRNPEKVLNRLSILEYVWSYSSTISTNTIDVHMTSLRRKIDGRYTKKIIKTVHGLGYKLSFEDD